MQITLVVRWIIGLNEQNQPVFRRQTIKCARELTDAEAMQVAQILQKYSKYDADEVYVQTLRKAGEL